MPLTPSVPSPAAQSPEEAIALLRAGNQRFASGHPKRESLTARRLELTAGQRPFAVVLGCSDSRVPVETIFDQIPGEIFVVRLAGNFATDEGLGSIEYGVAVLRAPLVVVLGHHSCGAVAAAVEYVKSGVPQPSFIMNLLRSVEPAVRAVRPQDGTADEDWVNAAIECNVRKTMHAIATRSPLIAPALADRSLALIGAIYDLHSGVVRFV